MIAQKLNIVINPVSGACDLACRYCIRSGTEALAPMTMETAEALLLQVFSMIKGGGEITFSFRGGEPTLAGIDFFRKFTGLAAQLCPAGCHLFWMIQTHGLNLDDRWIDLFIKYDFEVSIAVDGYQSIHDENRADQTGEGTWKRVRSLIRKLRQRDVVVSALCTITRQSSRRPEMIYRSLRKLGISNIVFRLCRAPEPWALTPPHLANFLCRVFDIWFEDWENGDFCFVNVFDDYIQTLRGQAAAPCGRCGDRIVIDADGSIYPCAAFHAPDNRLGAVWEGGLEAALQSLKYREFLNSGKCLPRECGSCSRAALCGGGCRADWITDRRGTHPAFCDAYKRFFLYACSRLVQIARETTDH